jgi:adenylate cyclase
VDADTLAAAGLWDANAPDADERLALLRWLAAQGATIEQMQRAEREGRLVSLAGDLALRPGPRYTAEDVAARTGLPAAQVAALTVAMGYRPLAPGEAWFTDADVDIFSGFVTGAGLFGAKPVERFTRIVGSSLARVAEAAVSLFLVNVEGPLRAAKAEALTLAERNLRAVQSLRAVETMLHGMFRAHVETAVRRQRRARRTPSVDTLHLTVGFVDLVGFTSLSGRMSSGELADVVERFEETAHEVVTARDGRLVKLIGDEVMFVAVDAAAACAIALDLVARFAGDDAVTPRGALVAGDVLFRGGDYYGPVVNLAARLADVAVPRELLVTPEVAAEAGTAGLRFEPAGRRMLKGFAAPVTLLALERGT